VAAQMTDPHGFQLIMNFLTMPIFFTSGALFPLDGIPEWLLILTQLNPLTYGVDGMRFALGGPHHFSPLLDLFVLLIFWLITTLVGTLLFRRMPA
jgi:ABC-2 type transport system permease protein